jgi:hypothetical protein
VHQLQALLLPLLPLLPLLLPALVELPGIALLHLHLAPVAKLLAALHLQLLAAQQLLHCPAHAG